MSVPDFQSLMLPLLRATSDGNEHTLGEIIELLAQQLNLSEEDRNELLPSGRQRKFDNRVNWARTYLGKTLLLMNTGRSKFRITDRGFNVLKDNPIQINIKFLAQFPEFLALRDGRANGEIETPQEIIEKTSQTPQEILEVSYQSLRRALAQEILERIKNSPPKFFESLVVDLLIAMGYGGSRKDAGQAVGKLEMGE